jgi:hypothetical protein
MGGDSITYKSKNLYDLFSCIGHDGDVGTILATFFELNGSVDKSVEGMVLAHTNVLTGVVDGATLTDDDVTGDTMLTAEDFNA